MEENTFYIREHILHNRTYATSPCLVAHYNLVLSLKGHAWPRIQHHLRREREKESERARASARERERESERERARESERERERARERERERARETERDFYCVWIGVSGASEITF